VDFLSVIDSDVPLRDCCDLDIDANDLLDRGDNVLILKRKLNETISIGADIHVQILGVNASGVTLGVEAPKSIPVRRTELARIADANLLNQQELSLTSLHQLANALRGISEIKTP
jgi:carbon storage regulator